MKNIKKVVTPDSTTENGPKTPKRLKTAGDDLPAPTQPTVKSSKTSGVDLLAGSGSFVVVVLVKQKYVFNNATQKYHCRHCFTKKYTSINSLMLHEKTCKYKM